MGSIRKKTENVLTEEKIQNIIGYYFMSQSNIKYMAENLYIYGWESDMWIMTISNYCYEFEIKISKSDFNNDFKHKENKHLLLENNKQNKIIPNYFYYTTPENLIDINDIPDYAGLIYITDIYPYYKIIKTAPKLSDIKTDENQLNIYQKFYYAYRNNKEKYFKEKAYTEELNNIIDTIQEKPEDNKKHYTKLLEENKTNKNKLNCLKLEYNILEKTYKNLENSYIDDRKVIHKLMGLLKNNNIEINYLDLYKNLDEY